MAKVSGPLHSSEARGKVGALVYNTWRGISYVRSYGTPPLPTSPAQLAHQAKFATAMTFWHAASHAYRNAWAHWANHHPVPDWTGRPVRLTAMQAYLKHAVKLTAIGLPPPASVPGDVNPSPPENWQMWNFPPELQSSWDTVLVPDQTGRLLQVFRSPIVSAANHSNLTDAILWTTEPWENGEFFIEDTFSGWRTYWARVLDPDTGMASPWVSLRQAVA